MSWLNSLGKDNRGSRPRCVLLTDGSREEVSGRPTDIVGLPEVSVAPEDYWMPRGRQYTSEAQLDKCQKMLSPTDRQKLSTWWLAIKGRSITPNWDIASTCRIRGNKGILLVEAKAHSEELIKENRSKAKDPNRSRIRQAVAQANSGLRNITGGPWNLSIEHHYQLSNRFAWPWKLASMGIPVVLVYLGFLNAVDMENPFRSEDEWEQNLSDYCNGVVDKNCWNREFDVEGTPFIPLSRVYDQPFDPHSCA